MRKSSNVSVYLFLYCKELVSKITKHVSDRESFKLKLLEYPSWFKATGLYTYWLDTYRLDAKEYVESAINLEDSKEHTSGVSMTSILVSSHLLRVSLQRNKGFQNPPSSLNWPDFRFAKNGNKSTSRTSTTISAWQRSPR